jgi:hypothetical protein
MSADGFSFYNTNTFQYPRLDTANIIVPPNGSTDSIQVNNNNGNVQLSSNTNIWQFGTNGILTLPTGSTINDTPAAPGVINGRAVEIKPGGVSHSNQLLRIYPTAPNPDGNHLHLTSGDLTDTDLFLGDDHQFVQIAADGNVCIGTYGTSGNIWQFHKDGNLQLPAGGVIVNSDSSVYGQVDTSSSVSTLTVSDASGDYQYGSLAYNYTVNGNGGGFTIAYSAPLAFGNVDINIGNVVTTGTANIGGNLIVGGNLLLSAGGQIQSPSGTGNVTIEANDGNNVRTYTFGTDGNITFPDGTKQGTAGGPGAITNSSYGSDAYQMTNERFMFVDPNGHLTSVILPQTPVDGQQATIVRTTGASIFANVVGSMTIAPTVSNPTGGNLMIDKYDINTQSSVSFVADLASHTWWLTAQVGF